MPVNIDETTIFFLPECDFMHSAKNWAIFILLSGNILKKQLKKYA